MTAAHSHSAPHPIEAKERKELARIRSEPKFKQAYAKYRKENSEFHIPYLAGSDKQGTTVYFDPRTPQAARKTIAIHEKTEGVLIRLYGFDYAKAHKYATQAEREVVGDRWRTYQAALEEPIRQAEKAPKRNMPPDLLQASYADPDRFTERKGSSRDARAERNGMTCDGNRT